VRERIERAWDEACWALGIRADRAIIADLIARYEEPHRRYHDVSHIDACLRVFDEHRGFATRPGEVIVALLFHDAVYDPTRADNETRSAALASAALADADPDARERIAAAIEATRTHEASEPDAALVIDVDLSILGAEPLAYDVFERAVRAEYAHVRDDAFRTGRRGVLERLAERPAIFVTPALRARYEDRARANLARAIAALR
jgi:predicted metal-dependent HD superfamily phosphohydrolase